MMEILTQPWPWYVAGALVGLTGISANLRHACAALIPANIPFFKYNWRKESWNLVFAAGILIGAVIATMFLSDGSPVAVDPRLLNELEGYGIRDHAKLLPREIFSFESLLTARGLVLLVGGGLLVGFGTRYAGGCTSGHSIMGLSNLQFPSLIATISFMAGGFIMANLILPLIMKL
jgi:uncharacterized protein